MPSTEVALAPPHRRTLRVLVVEDEHRLRELLLDVIPDMGFPTTAVRSAEEARRCMENEPHDIAILDLQLPGISRMDFFEALRRDWPGTQVIVLTGFGDLDSARRAIRMDVVDFLPKPCHLADIEVALDRARARSWHETRSSPQHPAAAAEGEPPRTLAEIEQQQIIAALSRNHGNRSATAIELGISRRTLHYRLRDYKNSGEARG